MVTRRRFLKGLIGLSVAPAIVRAENLMKIFVPPQELVIGRGLTKSIFTVDESALQKLGADYDGEIIIIRMHKQRSVSSSSCLLTRYPITGIDSIQMVKI